MKKLDHVGIAVKDLKEAISVFETILNTKVYKEEDVPEQQVKTVFLQAGESKIELLHALSDESAIAKFLNKKGEGIHHLAFEVDDIFAEIKRLQALGYELINSEPRKGADDKWIAFLHPKNTHGVLIEICQKIR
ncbi:methylmalonyl-CoA epimerase [Pedobacter puniceum]|uniref:Methylmalonyl-CoA epimerase n=1 Tax=Pedobacter puniceum TaxID=2666136 RepID=A0A7K0FRN8_9SPHI|nr:methylmalonyl-CoA epimerase [Pedobacter puniceum]MRX48412.1 methylmalonyl-CoA epimerase [Pedobacter puniceum]